LGKWGFVGETSRFGNVQSELKEPDPALPFKQTVEFCVNGECKFDGEGTKYYWVDGRLDRLSFQSSRKPKEYSNEWEFDLIQIKNDELVIRQFSPLPPSMKKTRGGYPTPDSFGDYRFKRER
jgi:hypothetical protein